MGCAAGQAWVQRLAERWTAEVRRGGPRGVDGRCSAAALDESAEKPLGFKACPDRLAGVKGNSLLVGLASILAAFSAGVTSLAYQYVQLTRALNNAQYTIAQVELRQNRLKALVNEALEYSKRDPAINPLLMSIGAKQSAGAPRPTDP